jgi:hypothetical protein
MKRILFIVLSFSVLSTVTGCYVDPALFGPASVEVEIGAYPQPYYWDSYLQRYDWYDDWRYRRWDSWRDRHSRYERWEP